MSILHSYLPPAKAGRRNRCAACDGLGYAVGDCGARDCPACDGFGHYKDAGDDGQAPPVHYLATQGGDAVETGLTLDGLLEALSGTFTLKDEDVVIWRITEGRGPRVAAVVSPGVRGNIVRRT